MLPTSSSKFTFSFPEHSVKTSKCFRNVNKHKMIPPRDFPSVDAVVPGLGRSRGGGSRAGPQSFSCRQGLAQQLCYRHPHAELLGGRLLFKY